MIRKLKCGALTVVASGERCGEPPRDDFRLCEGQADQLGIGAFAWEGLALHLLYYRQKNSHALTGITAYHADRISFQSGRQVSHGSSWLGRWAAAKGLVLNVDALERPGKNFYRE